MPALTQPAQRRLTKFAVAVMTVPFAICFIYGSFGLHSMRTAFYVFAVACIWSFPVMVCTEELCWMFFAVVVVAIEAYATYWYVKLGSEMSSDWWSLKIYDDPCGKSSCSSNQVTGIPYNPWGWSTTTPLQCPSANCRWADVTGVHPRGYFLDAFEQADLTRPCPPPTPTSECDYEPTNRKQDYSDLATGIAMGLQTGTTNDLEQCPRVAGGVGLRVCSSCTDWFVDQGRLVSDGQTCGGVDVSDVCWLCPGGTNGESFDVRSVRSTAEMWLSLLVLSVFFLVGVCAASVRVARTKTKI